MGTGAKKTVSLIGFRPLQRQVIQRICLLSENRDRKYEFVDSTTVAKSDFYLVDAEDLSAIDQWQAFASAEDATSTIFVGDHPVSDALHQIKRSQLASQLLNILDDLSEKSDLAAAAKVAGTIGKPKIMIVDDSLSVRTQMSICLQDFNIDVVAVESAEDGVGVVSRTKIDLVFLDVMLPGMNGYEACGKLKKASAAALPVVLLTSKSSPFNKVRGVMAGCDRYLTKPADVRELAKVISHFLGDAVVRPAPTDVTAVAN